MTFAHSIVKTISAFAQGHVMFLSLQIFLLSWWQRRGGRKAWEDWGLIFIPEISKLALELRKKSVGFPPLGDTASMVDVPQGGSSNINYLFLSFKSFLLSQYSGYEHTGKLSPEIFHSTKICCSDSAILGTSVYPGCPRGENWDGIDRGVSAFCQGAAVQEGEDCLTFHFTIFVRPGKPLTKDFFSYCEFYRRTSLDKCVAGNSSILNSQHV